jgi:hypothetical protein
MIQSEPEDYNHIVISKTMLSDHFPWYYETALAASSGRRDSMMTYQWF